MKQRKMFTRVRVALLCLLMLAVLLLVSACGDSSGPGSQPSSPSNGGYSIIHVLAP